MSLSTQNKDKSILVNWGESVIDGVVHIKQQGAIDAMKRDQDRSSIMCSKQYPGMNAKRLYFRSTREGLWNLIWDRLCPRLRALRDSGDTYQTKTYLGGNSHWTRVSYQDAQQDQIFTRWQYHI